MHDDVKYDVFVSHLLELVANTNLPIASHVGSVRTHMVNSGFPMEFTDDYISGWLGSEATKLAAKYTSWAETDEVLDRAGLELNDSGILHKLKAINNNELSCKIVAYLYLYAKLTDHSGMWRRAVDVVDTYHEEATSAA